jgi:ketosteroid isomerase-like protein
VDDIRTVIAAYAQALDDARWEDVVATYCPDATVVIPRMAVMHGHDEIRAGYATVIPNRPRRHIITNTIITPVDDQTATAISDLLVLSKGDAGWAIVLVGRYTDEFRCDDGAWRCSARRLEFS